MRQPIFTYERNILRVSANFALGTAVAEIVGPTIYIPEYGYYKIGYNFAVVVNDINGTVGQVLITVSNNAVYDQDLASKLSFKDSAVNMTHNLEVSGEKDLWLDRGDIIKFMGAEEAGDDSVVLVSGSANASHSYFQRLH